MTRSTISITAAFRNGLANAILAGCLKAALYRTSGSDPSALRLRMYGTTLRVFDPGIGGWHIIWSDPLNQDYARQIGRAERTWRATLDREPRRRQAGRHRHDWRILSGRAVQIVRKNRSL
ncbi:MULTISPECIES: hypothetical protein [unclassified Mesorhizobium]|uniref:hypothetical protein n=1 Tax=unclassified Mesorhizobium TaxID=325217 RepID=UPI001672009D|nr:MULTISPECIES: hypothetical protein [unclassified Mesorhizobium]